MKINTQNENIRINIQNEKIKYKSFIIIFIKMIIFIIISNQFKAQLYIINILQFIEINFIVINNFNNIISDSDFSLILEEYHEFANIFNKKKVYKLFLYQLYNHHISLQEKIIPSFNLIYTLISEKLKVL